jgi:hypothetical protein
MEALKSKIREIERELQNASRLLNLYDRTSRIDVGKDVTKVGDTIADCQYRIEHVISEMDSFMRQIEYHPAGEVDLKPQIAWLGRCMTSILEIFQNAGDHAQDAIATTMNYDCLVNDVFQDVAVQQRELDDAGQTANAMADVAEEEIRNIELLLREKESSIRSKTQEIASKTSDAARLRVSLGSHESSLRQNELDLSSAQVDAHNRKLASGISFVGIFVANLEHFYIG